MKINLTRKAFLLFSAVIAFSFVILRLDLRIQERLTNGFAAKNEKDKRGRQVV
jgi:hypothetical protein